MADNDQSIHTLRYNQISGELEGFGGGSPQWTQLTLTNTDPTQVPVTRQINTTAPLQGGGNLSANRTLSIPVATSLANGYLSSADWTTFNAKQPAGSYITALTGDATASGPGSAPITLATVNSDVGSFTSANITVDAKGRITAASNGSGATPGGSDTQIQFNDGGTFNGATITYDKVTGDTFFNSVVDSHCDIQMFNNGGGQDDSTIQFDARYINLATDSGQSVIVGSSNPVDASSLVELDSTTKGFLPPRMTTTQKNAIATPAEGLVVYDTTLHKLAVWTGAAWETVTSA